jgi:hypothetical protein
MSGVETLSDEELMRELQSEGAGGNVSDLTDEEILRELQAQEAPTPGFDPKRPIMSAMGAITGAIDPYTGAPVRAGIGAAIEGNNPLTAAYEQFGKPSETAPTGRELSEKMGVPESASPYTGMAIDVLADPTLLIPGGAVGRATKGAKSVAGKVGPKVGSTLSGIPSKEIATFSKDFDRVSKMMKQYGEAPDVAADVIREGYQSKLQSFRRGINRDLENALSSAEASKRLPVAPITEAIATEQKKLNPKLYTGDHSALTDLQKRVLSIADEQGTVSAKEMHELKQFLDDLAKPEWNAMGQKVFTSGDKVARAAKQGANIARKEVNAAVPAAKEANQKLSALRQVEDKLNKNLIAPAEKLNSSA